MTPEEKAAQRLALKEKQRLEREKLREEAAARMAEEKVRLREMREQERLKVSQFYLEYGLLQRVTVVNSIFMVYTHTCCCTPVINSVSMVYTHICCCSTAEVNSIFAPW